MRHIGAVSIDIHKRERPFEDVTLSDKNVIKWLILYRDKVDIYFESEENNNFNEAGNTEHLNQELIALYADLDRLIEKCDFKDKQSNLLKLLSRGYSYTDAGEFPGIDMKRQNVKKMFDVICNSIVKANELDWMIWIHSNVLRTKFKRCTKCKKEFPATDKFFGKDKGKYDGFKSSCKKC